VKYVVVDKTYPIHGVHLFLSLITCGLWTSIWFLISALYFLKRTGLRRQALKQQELEDSPSPESPLYGMKNRTEWLIFLSVTALACTFVAFAAVTAKPIPQPPQQIAAMPKPEPEESIGTKSWHKYQAENYNLCSVLRSLGGPKC
jgi:hypothetical protein